MLTTPPFTFQSLTLHLPYKPTFLNVSLLSHPGRPSFALNLTWQKQSSSYFLPNLTLLSPSTLLLNLPSSSSSTLLRGHSQLLSHILLFHSKHFYNCRFFLHNITKIHLFLCCSTIKNSDSDPHSLPS
ncbi:hypothetical protein FKM82_020958 [Ascaphus truei]